MTETVSRILDQPLPEKVRVELQERSYDIFIGRGLIGAAAAHILPLLAKRHVVIITDANVAKLHLEALAHALTQADIKVDTIILPAGEATKSFAQVERLITSLVEMKIERSTTLIALGGGVIGDLTGFVAAITLRGIDFIQIPTTLLAQVDSSVGGKTGINTSQGKNLVGAFYQPRLVLTDTATLDTLPRRELLAGYAEIVKYALIDEPEFFTWLEANGIDVIEGDDAARRRAIAISCRAKARIVGADERESGARALLNLGHTFGHALEAECGFSDELLHGEGVAIGMMLAFELSVTLGLCPMEEAARAQRHLASIGLPTTPHSVQSRFWSAERLIEHMSHDKKMKNGRLGFVLTRGIGKSFYPAHVDLAQVVAFLKTAITP